MNKEVIYIDVDDDVTAIIGKIKQSKEKIIALVPPKRAGVLQSAVNLRLLERMASADKKQLVLITGSQALVALAASARIPVAKNLQTKPEIAEIPALMVDDGDDIIDGAELPIGEHAKTGKNSQNPEVISKSNAINETDLSIDDANNSASGGNSSAGASSNKPKKATKIPNFDTFRKKLVLIILGGVGLLALLIWMFVFAPAATIVITAQTNPQAVSSSVRLGGTEATNFEKGIISSISKQEIIDEKIEFEATGTGEVGERAKGSVVFRNCEDAAAITIAAGTTISTGSTSFVTQSAVTVPGGTGGFYGCSDPGISAAVAVVAADIGDSFNKPSGTVFAVSGHPNTATVYMRAVSSTDLAGGSSRTVTVVSDKDVEQATGNLVGKSTDQRKADMKKSLESGKIAIDSSFSVQRGTPVVSPAVGAEVPASGKATLTIPTTYTIYAVATDELTAYLEKSITSKINTSNQKIYNTGADTATLANFRKDGENSFVNVNATGRVGPRIDEAAVKEQSRGKIFGEVQSALQAQQGISQVDVRFSYFWVRTVPNNTNRITVEFKVTDDN